jgi:hypothetical protein
MTEFTDLDLAEQVREAETRQLVSVRIVDSLEPIEGADAIELAVIGGWKCVVKKGDVKPGEPAIYIEIDSFLPDGNPAWQFLVDKQPREQDGVRGHRLRTIKLRGQISQGLVLPLSSIPEIEYFVTPRDAIGEKLDSKVREILDELIKDKHRYGLEDDGFSLQQFVNVVKWDPPLPAQLQGKAAGLFPSFIKKTDQERAQNIKNEIFQVDDAFVLIEDMKVSDVFQSQLDAGYVTIQDGNVFSIRKAKAQRDAQYEKTMKMDGSSATYFKRADHLGLASRNLELKIEGNEGNTFVDMGHDGGLFKALEAFGQNLAIQGELMGPAIQKNREELKDFKLFVFDLYDIDRGEYLTPEERHALMFTLYSAGLDHKKVVHSPVWTQRGFVENVEAGDQFLFTLEELGITNMDELLAHAEGPSLKHVYREGLVYKRRDGKFSFKTISNSYLAKEKD